MRSLKWILILSTTTGAVVILLVAGITFYFLVRANLVAQYDRLLLDKARLLAAIPEQGSKKLHLDLNELEFAVLGSAKHPAFVQVWSATGTTLYRSPNLQGVDLERRVGSIEQPLHSWIDLPGGVRGRMVSVTFTPRREGVNKRPGTQREGGKGLAKSARPDGTEAQAVVGDSSGTRAGRPATKKLGRGYRMAQDARVAISEFMATNKSVLADRDGDFSDWIEVHNFSSQAVDLNGWYLTDRADEVLWQFPQVRVPSDGYILVFASAKDRRNPSAELHTNFKLTADGEYLALVRPDGKEVEFAYVPKFPRQIPDVSYGRAGDSFHWGYFRQPTPGRPNTTPYTGTRPLSPTGPVTLVLARDAQSIDAALARLAALLGLVGIAVVPALGTVLWLVIRGNLRPVDRLATEISGLREEDLGKRIAVPEAPRELRPIIDRLNRLLEQLDAAFQRERGFSADVAHELRTPLAGLRLQMDLALSRSRAPEEYQVLIENCREIAMQMHGMVENLLLLARLEGGRLTLRHEPVLLDTLVHDAWKPLDETARLRKLHVDWALEPNLRVMTDRERIAVAVRNLLENAVTYVNEGGDIAIEGHMRNGAAVFRVRNSGSCVREADADRVFERFWRASTARSATGSHCGLGLALTKRVVEALGGSVEVSTLEGADFTISVTLPNGRGPENGR